MRSDGVALALTALPVLLTTVLLRLPWSIAALPPPYRDFAAYAAANWLTFALVLRLVGRQRLRDLGRADCVGDGRLLEARDGDDVAGARLVDRAPFEAAIGQELGEARLLDRAAVAAQRLDRHVEARDP
jgi:hypothetical protein